MRVMPLLKPDILIIALDPAGVETAMAAAGIMVRLVTQGPLAGCSSGLLPPAASGWRLYQDRHRRASAPTGHHPAGRHAAPLAAPLPQCLKDQRSLADLADLSVPAQEEAQAVAALGRLALPERLLAPGTRPLLCTMG